VTERLDVGHVVQGIVINVADFGAFVALDQGIEGLVHNSEVPDGQATLSELEPGAPISVRVLEIDHDRRRIALSLRGIDSTTSQAFQDGWSELNSAQVDAEALSGEQVTPSSPDPVLENTDLDPHLQNVGSVV
jgi:ribosomal protein S1